ncbi:MAG TPA: hypothetical protein VKB05_01280 [Pyrinomonadaceae bacterium]|nr:hypothetical protein [Pyrinomonadaceae bacterium]
MDQRPGQVYLIGDAVGFLFVDVSGLADAEFGLNDATERAIADHPLNLTEQVDWRERSQLRPGATVRVALRIARVCFS